MNGLFPVLRIALIWLLAWLLLFAIRNFLHAFKTRFLERLKGQANHRRIETLSGVIRHATTFVIVGLALLLSLAEIGISIGPLLATAGIAGIAIGFGAQNLVKDFITGLFMLIEGQVSEGDLVEAGGKAGIVEEVTLRHLRLRDESGNVHFIPNGIVTTITNSSRGYAYAVIDLPVSSDRDPEEVFRLMQTVYFQLHGDAGFGPYLNGELVIDGIEKLESSTMVLRCRLQVAPGWQMKMRREFLRRIRLALETATDRK